jgi:hypothetical protein
MSSGARRAIISVLMIFLGSASMGAQERAYLDSTQATIQQRRREPNVGSIGGIMVGYSEQSGRQQPVQPLSLYLKILGRPEFARGDVFEYEVQIQNVSDHPVEIPWDLSQADVEPADPRASYQYQTAAIVLNAKVGDHSSVTMEGSILLFGAPALRTTTVNLHPGEWARVKAKTRALSSNPNDPWPPSDLAPKRIEGRLTATLMFSSSTFTRAAAGGSQEDSHATNDPISSNACNVQFVF